MAKRDRDSRAEHARRQDAARRRGYSSAYRARIARMQELYPGISRKGARGHPSRDEREIIRFIKAIRKAPAESQVLFAGIERQPDGTWRFGRFDMLPGDGSDIVAIEVEPSPMWHAIDDAMRAAGIQPLGADYFRQLLSWIDEDMVELEEAA